MLLWLTAACALTLVLAAGLAVVDVRRVPLLTHVSHVPILADPHLTRRLIEADTTRTVDVLLVGSSHAYRGLDPREFASRGLRAFNLGSSAQTPTLTDALLERYLPRLRPRLVLVETYPVTIDGDGFEGFSGLAASAPIDRTALRLAIHQRTPSAVLALVGGAARRALGRPSGQPEGRYVAAGFVVRTDTLRDARLALRREPARVDVTKRGLRHLSEVAARIRGAGARPVFVEMPVTTPLRATVQGYDAASAAVERQARHLGVPFLRVGAWPLGLSDRAHFYDPDHLNAAGVARVNEALLDTLERRGLLPSTQ